MKRASKLRIFLVVVLALLLFAIFFREARGPVIEPGSTLVLELEGEYVEAPQAPLVARLLGEETRPFAGLLSTFAMAERDDRLSAVVLVIRPLSIGWGKAGELRDSIGRLREAGRKTVAFLEIASFGASREYYVASAADEVYVVPGGAVPVVGLAAEYFFLGGFWEKLGISFEIGKAGKYKSAVEAYTGDGMSEPTREMATSLLDSANEAFLEAIATGRGLDRAAVTAAIDRGPMLPDELVELGLADGSRHLGELLDGMPGEIVQHNDYAGVQPEDVGFEPEARVALVYGSGTVVQGRGSRSRGGRPVMASETVGQALRDAAEDPQIDAILFRIDSPGGSALAAEQIWQAMMDAREHGKPVMASFSDVAASGGYYVAAAADGIVSNGGTLTGSIGVFALRPVLGGALDKLGIELESMTRGKHADFLLAGEPLSEGARARLQEMVLRTYTLFLGRVSAGRDMAVAEVDAVAQGRVWTGRQAVDIGLVDELGGMRVAVDRIREQLGLAEDADVVLVPFPARRSLSEEIADLLDARIAKAVADGVRLPDAARRIQAWWQDLPLDSPVLVPPMLVEIR